MQNCGKVYFVKWLIDLSCISELFYPYFIKCCCQYIFFPVCWESKLVLYLQDINVCYIVFVGLSVCPERGCWHSNRRITERLHTTPQEEEEAPFVVYALSQDPAEEGLKF
jgi:hypothetical protein